VLETTTDSDFAELRECDLCTKPFVADEDWKRKCLLCWKEENGYKTGKGDRAFELMRDAYTKAVEQTEQERVKGRKVYQAYKDARKAYTSARKELKAFKAKPPPVMKSNDGLTQARVKALIRLCHPDRHGNSEMATEITKWLLRKRNDVN